MNREPYDHNRIEAKWQAVWEKEKTWRAADPSAGREKRYVLDMFPYPSAQGLHVGHPEGYTASDIYSRYLRMRGFSVLHPMGFDAFGLPAENYALKTGTHPAETTAANIKNMRAQIKRLGFSYDWDREVVTTDPAYFKWTQWIFVQLFKHGLAYEADAPINWCPKDKTGLANEEVVGGKCERCGTPVTRKKIKQWLVKITDSRYIERLEKDLDKVDWPESIKLLQKNWIGRSEGATINFEIRNPKSETNSKFKIRNSKQEIGVFTTRPDTLFGATYMVLSPEHPLVSAITTAEQKKAVAKYQEQAAAKSDLERTELAKDKTGVFTGAYAINPVNDRKIPIWIADYVLSSYGTGAIMAVPGHDARDHEFAKKYKLPIVKVIEPPKIVPPRSFEPAMSPGAWGHLGADLESECWTGDGAMVNSGKYDGMDSVEFKKTVVEWLQSKVETQHSTCLVVHGIAGHKKENWFPWLKTELHKLGWETFVPTMPGAGHPTLEMWYEHLAQYREQINESSVLVGHSLGCASILHYLQESGKNVDTVILVAPTNPLQQWSKLKKEYPDYDWEAVEKMNRAKNFDWAKIGKLAKRFILIHSDNDPYIPAESISYFKKNIPQVEIHLIPGKYHFSEGNGIKSLPEILPYFPKQHVAATAATNYKLRDWLFSRQRYWGEPIPIVHCQKCGNVAVPEADLPLELLKVKQYEPTGTGESPLAAIEDWVNTTCPQCGGPAKRETNTMPQWAGSNWYFLRYIDPHNDKQIADPEKLKAWLPVDLYVGGAEHAVLHLLYARFIYKFLFDIGVVPKECGNEPFVKLKNQGLILGEDGQKMSKSRGNVVNPDEVITQYGADAMRMYEMFMGPFEDSKPWSTQGIKGVSRFLHKVWNLQDHVTDEALSPTLGKELNKLIRSVTDDIESFNFNTVVSALMKAVNLFKEGANIPRIFFEQLLVVLSPFAPHIAEEMWGQLGHAESISKQEWPSFDASKIVEAEVTYAIQINGKLRDTVTMAADAEQTVVERQALASAKVQKWLQGKQPKKVIFIKGKLVSIVV